MIKNHYAIIIYYLSNFVNKKIFMTNNVIYVYFYLSLVYNKIYYQLLFYHER